MSRDVVGLLARLSGVHVDLVGHSLGGLVACRVAAAGGSRVRRLVLEDVGVPHPRPPALPTRPEGELRFDWRMVEQIRPQIDDPDPRWPQLMSAIRQPTLVVAGGSRSSVPQEHVSELVGLLPEGQLVTLDTGHLVHASSPVEFTELLLGFLDEK